MRYDDAYFISENKIISLDTIEKTFKEQGKNKGREKYTNNLFCPFCKKVKLVTNCGEKKSFYLSDYPNTEHEETCPKLIPVIEIKKIDDFIKKNRNNKKLNEKLQELLDKLEDNKKEIQHTPNPFILIDKENEIIESKMKITKKNCTQFNQIPTKLLNNSLREEDYDTFKFFYGEFVVEKVQITREENTDKPKTIWVYLKNSSNTISLWLNKYACVYVNTEVFENAKSMQISFIGKITKNKNYNNVRIYDSRDYEVSIRDKNIND